MEHLKLIEFNVTYPQADSEPFVLEKVAIFDDRHVSEEEVMRMIEADEASPAVVYMTKEQYIQVFARSFQETFCIPEDPGLPLAPEAVTSNDTAQVIEAAEDTEPDEAPVEE